MINLDRDNHFDAMKILRDLRHHHDAEYNSSRPSVTRLYKANTTCTGFMGSDPDAQLQYAVENGLIPRSDF